MHKLWVAYLAVFVSGAAQAQSEYGGGWTVNTLDVSSSIAQDVITQEMYARNRLTPSGSGGSRVRGAAAGAVVGGAGGIARSTASPAKVGYESTKDSMRAAQDAYLARLTKKDPASAKLLAAEFRRNDFSRVYAGIVRPFGLSTNDAADALAGYTLLGWLIATGAPDPQPAAVRAVRNQFAGRLLATPSLSGPVKRRELGEELKISFVTLHAGWQSARKEGTLREYSDNIATMFQRQGTDLRALRLTNDGFTAR